MKTKFVSLFILFMCVSVMGISKNFTLEKEGKTTAKYNGVTEDGLFKFTDDKKAVVTFEQVSDDVVIDLYQDKHIGAKFNVYWEEEQIDMYDDEGELTGETETIKTITKLEVVK